jgi:hypothetical protein
MRRLGLLVVSLLLTVDIFNANHAFSAVTKAQFDSTVESRYNANVAAIQDGVDASIFGVQLDALAPAQKLYLRNQLYSAADEIFNQYGAKDTTTVASITVLTMDRWVAVLQQLKDGSNPLFAGTDTVLTRMIANVQAAQGQAGVAQQTQAGKLTPAQANAQSNAIAKQQSEALQKTAESSKDCSIISSSGIIGCIDAGFAWLVRNTLLQIAGVLLVLSSQILNISVTQGILSFNSWAPDSLYPIWLVVRQIVSLAVVFAGLYLGFMYIIGRQETFNRYIGWLVIFALFVNFSYPITRMMTDLSNVVSLNIYSATVGSAALSGNSTDSAGTMIKSRLGLDGLITSVNDKQSVVNNDLANIRSTPNALLLVAFVCYAAYVLFMTAGILIVRTVLLVMLTVASPLLLVDSVIPKLGDAAAKMRKLFFEQLVVAPVFMILFALTLKFMDVFRAGWSANAGTAMTFFDLMMMLIMLHITYKITKDIAGKAGEMATGFMGKVGGFGLAAATGGAGLLARGTIGAAASRFAGSAWMDKMQGSSVGRGLYGLSNSLAQSSFDARNIGMVSRGMASAGLTGMGGLSLQQGTSKGGYDQRAKAREEEVARFGSNIRDDTARAKYFANANRGLNRLAPKVDEARLRETEREVKARRETQLSNMLTANPEQQASLLDKAKLSGDYELEKRLNATKQYLGVKNDPNNPKSAQEKARLLKEMGIEQDQVKEFLKKDPFKDLADAHEKVVTQLQEDAAKIDRSTPEGDKEYRQIQAKIGKTNADHRQMVDQLRSQTLAAFNGEMTLETAGQTAQRTSTQAASTTREIDTSALDIAGFAAAPTGTQAPQRTFDTSALDQAGLSGNNTGANTYPVTNTIQPVQGGFIYQGNFYQSMTDAASAAARATTLKAQSGNPTPAPAPQTSPMPQAPAPQAATPMNPAPAPMRPAPAPQAITA